MELSTRRIFEIAVVVTIVGSLLFFLLPVLDDTRFRMEDAAVQAEAAAIRIDLLDRLAHHQAVGGKLPQSANPVQWIGRVPKGYLGELESAPEARGVWYFDRRAGELVYRFQASGEARFRLVRGAGSGGAPGVLAGVGLARIKASDK